MATNIQNVTSADLSVSTRSQYASSALNEKFIALAKGIVRGFTPRPTGNPNEVGLFPDVLLQESVLNAVVLDGSAAYAITYRTTTVIELDLTVLASQRAYIAFVPFFSASTETTGQWRAYTEAEYESGQLATDNALLCTVVNLDASPSTPVNNWDVWVAGRSQGGSPTLFLRESDDNFHAAHGPNEKKLAIHFQANPYFTGQEQLSGTAPGYTDTERNGSSGSLVFTTTGQTYLGDHVSVWQENTNANETKNGTLVLQYWVKTTAGLAGAFEIFPRFYSATGVSSDPATEFAGRVPTKQVITSDTLNWRLVRYEMKIPHGAPDWTIRAVSVRLVASSTVSSATVYVGGVQAWITNEEVATAGGFGNASRVASLVSPGLRGRLKMIGDTPSARAWSLYRNGADECRIEADASLNVATFRVSANGGPTKLTLVGDATSASELFASGAWIASDAGVRSNTVAAYAGDEVEILKSTLSASGARLRVQTIKANVIRSRDLLGLGPSVVLFTDDNNQNVCEVRSALFRASNSMITNVIETTDLRSPSVNGIMEVIDPNGALTVTLRSGIFETFGYYLGQEYRPASGANFLVRDELGADTAQLRVNNILTTNVDATGWVRASVFRSDNASSVQMANNSGSGVEVNAQSFYALDFFRVAEVNGQWGISGSPLEDRLYRGNLPVVQGSFRITANGALSNPALLGTDSFGVNAMTENGTDIEINLKNAMQDANYTVILSTQQLDSNAVTWEVESKTSTKIIVQERDLATGAVLDPTQLGNDSICHFVVFGKQS